METLEMTVESIRALQNDQGVKAWLRPNEVLFRESGEHRDMFLTTWRFRNAYENLLNKLELNEEVKEELDLILIRRYFDMMFYPPKKLTLSECKEGRDPVAKIVKAYKDTRWKGNRRRKFEITLILDNGKAIQINPNDVLNNYLYIRSNFETLSNSNL